MAAPTTLPTGRERAPRRAPRGQPARRDRLWGDDFAAPSAISRPRALELPLDARPVPSRAPHLPRWSHPAGRGGLQVRRRDWPRGHEGRPLVGWLPRHFLALVALHASRAELQPW